MSKKLQRRFFFCLPVNRGTIKHHGEHGAHKAVGNVVQLLEDDAAEHGQAELPQNL